MAAGLSAAEGQVKKSTEAMAAKFASIGKTMTIVGGVITAAFGVIIKKTMEAGDKFDKMSLRTGESVENLSSLAYACDITGTSIEGLEIGIKFLTKGMDDASQGIGLAKDAFEYLGMSVKDTEGNLRPTVEVLKEAATKIAAIENPAKQAALAMDLFGARSGTQLIPLLKLGGAGIDELMNKAKELGITMSTETAKAAAEFKDRLEDLKGSLAGVGRDIAMILIPPLTKLAIKAVEIVKKIKEWAEAHKPLVELIVKVAATLGALAAVGGPILLATSAFLKMQGAITALGTATTGPIGIAILAIAAIAVGTKLLYDHLKETVGGMRDFREGLKLMSLLQIDIEIQSLTDSVEQLQKRFSEIPKGIGQQEILTMIDEINKRLGMLSERREELTKLATGVDNLTDSIGGLGDQLENTGEKLDEFGNKIETFDEWVARLAEKSEEANKKMAEAAEDAYQRYKDAMQPIEDRLYELSHTEEEVAAKNLLTKKNQLEKSIKAAKLSAEKEKEELTKIKDWYIKEIDLIKAKLVEQQNALIETANKTEESASIQKVAIKGITDEYTGLINKIDAVGKAAEAAAKKATSEAFLAGVPTIAETGYVPSYIPKLQMGTPYVPKTGLYQLHQGEAVIPANQLKMKYIEQQLRNLRIYNEMVEEKKSISHLQNPISNTYSFSPIVNLTVSGGGNASNIAYEVKKVLDESIRQFRRSGFELVPGRG